MRSLSAQAGIHQGWTSLNRRLRFCTQCKQSYGGFQYLFENDFPHKPPYSKFAEAYRRIGSDRAADRLEKAVAMFPFGNPHLHQDLRLTFMETLEEESEFFELGNAVCGDEKVWTDLEAYAKTNAASFPVSIN